MWCLIGGSGFEKFDGFKTIGSVERDTPFGMASSGIKKVELDGVEFLFVSRHGEHHELLPSEVNYRANIFALKRAGGTKILSVSAVGSLRKKLEPGDMVVPTQYIDRTKSLRSVSFCGEGVVGHVALAEPVSVALVEQLKTVAKKLDFPIHWEKTYICIEGPYFSTKAESKYYREMGADIIGMTNFPEFALAREAGMSYLPCSFVTDFDSWDDDRPHVTLSEVLDVMKKNNSKAFNLLRLILNSDLEPAPEEREAGLRTGLMSPMETLSPDQQAWLKILKA